MATIAPKTRRSQSRRAAYQHVDRVEVYPWDELIGAMALDPGYGYYAFAWAPDFIESGVQPAPLQMPTDRFGSFIFPNRRN